MNPETPNTPPLQSEIDATLGALVRRSRKFAEDREISAKDLSVVGQFVLKAREHLMESGVTAEASLHVKIGGTLSPNTLRQIEEGIRML